MNKQTDSTSTLEMFGYGMAGVATYELGKKALPYAWKGTKKAAVGTANAAKKAGSAVAAVETYQAGKNGGTKSAVKQGVKSASGLACGAAGAKIGALAGACTGPAAPVAVPVLSAVGAVTGYLGGEKLMDTVTSWFE